MKRGIGLLLLALCLVCASAAAEGEIPITLMNDRAECADRGVLIEGSTVTIQFPGTYLISGKLSDGQIKVNCDIVGKVTLLFDGVDVRCERGPALLIDKVSPRLSIHTAEGSVNRLSAGRDFVLTDGDEPNGAVFSKSDLTISGSGTLNVVSEYMDGVVSKDDLRVKGGVLNVTAPRNGLRGKDNIEVTDGVITITAGNDGMKSTNEKEADRGYILISGGTINITCGDDPISVITRLTITGGAVNAQITEAE